jgi:hypothetical protein
VLRPNLRDTVSLNGVRHVAAILLRETETEKASGRFLTIHTDMFGRGETVPATTDVRTVITEHVRVRLREVAAQMEALPPKDREADFPDETVQTLTSRLHLSAGTPSLTRHRPAIALTNRAPQDGLGDISV